MEKLKKALNDASSIAEDLMGRESEVEVFVDRFQNIRKDIVLPAYTKAIKTLEDSNHGIKARINAGSRISDYGNIEALEITVNGEVIILDVNCDTEKETVILKVFNETRNLNQKIEHHIDNFNIESIEDEIIKFFSNHIW
jgi:hypothetical protein